MRIQDESREEKYTNPEHEPMIEAIFQGGEENKINNLLNVWKYWGLKGEFDKVTNLQQPGKQTKNQIQQR